MSPHVLILGGTAEARELAAVLAARPGVRVTTSLAGRVTRPGALAGDVRVGGFGGAAGLADWMREQHVDALVDATHPFAETITANGARARRPVECRRWCCAAPAGGRAPRTAGTWSRR